CIANHIKPSAFRYAGDIYNSVVGVFWRNYSGEFLIATQFQPEYARTLFPSIDAPNYKATFTLSLIHRTNTRALGNSVPSEIRQLNKEWMRTDFMQSIPLPTYLFAFAILPQSFRVVSKMTTFGVLVHIHGPRSFERFEATAELAVRCAELAYDMFKIPLTLSKIDFLVVKNTGPASGMENWGLVTLSEEYLMEADDAHAIYLISHEIVHHWIGNLMTISDWSQACLQEDLADFIALKILRIMSKSDRRYERFRLSRYLAIQLAETVFTPDEPLVPLKKISISRIGRQCYLKGVIHLETLEAIIGEPQMMNTVRQLIRDHRFSNFQIHDFSKAFANVTVDRIFNLEQVYEFWAKSKGFPSLLYEKTSSGVRITQLLGSTLRELWPLYVNFENHPHMSEIMTVATKTVAVSSSALLNPGFLAFYRVNYDSELWSAIQKRLENEPEKYGIVQRAQLVADFCYFNSKGLVRNGETLRKKFIQMVYRRPEYYDLCEWYLYWCNQASSGSRSGSEIFRDFLIDWVASFDNSDHYKCLTGKAVKIANRFCQKVIGTDCL
ncbi:unnamed protein product, partial [Enterobius vermicularis]|uniref:Peptidase_M1 domain-containing protein n=1 Tax=Enterobius vermicularis TaxID=51028 RepID=A0A0N4VCI9_ENTVE